MIVAIAGGVLGFWVLFVWRVRVERGWVGVSDLARATLRFRVGMRKLQVALGEALLPVVRRATRAISAWNAAYAKAFEVEEDG